LSCFSFSLIPKNCAVFGIRVDKDSSNDPVHTNPDPRLEVKYGKHRLHYPQDVDLNIDHFCLLYFLVLVLWYQASGVYPLDHSVAETLNGAIGKLRKQVEK